MWTNRRRSRPAGFTLVELLVALAIIGILASIAVPQLLGAMRRSRKNALIADGRTLFTALVQYNMDRDEYPPCCSPPSAALNPSTLHPLTTDGYLPPGSITGRLDGGQLSLYDSPDAPTSNHDFYAVMTWARDPTLSLLVADTDEYPGHAGETLYGLYLIVGGTLVPVAEDS